MKIVFDNEIFKKQRFGGISRYFSEIIKGLRSAKGYEVIPKSFYSSNEHLISKNLTRFNKLSQKSPFSGKGKIENLLYSYEEKKFEDILKANKFDIFHPTYYSTAFTKYLHTNTPFVLTVHDMIHEIYYDNRFEFLHSETINKRKLIPKASHIVAVSQNTKNDILRFFPEIDENKISVVYHGSSISQTTVINEFQIPDKYILYVGTRGFYKNFFWLLKAISTFLKKRNIILLCAGGGHVTEFEKFQISNSDLSKYVEFITVSNDGDLVHLYNNACCMIFPSLMEGFGIPILEAFACACPVLLTNASCFPEIAGNAASYFEPNDKDGMIKQLEKILDDKEYANYLKEMGTARLKEFSWQKAVNQHINIYNSIKL